MINNQQFPCNLFTFLCLKHKNIRPSCDAQTRFPLPAVRPQFASLDQTGHIRIFLLTQDFYPVFLHEVQLRSECSLSNPASQRITTTDSIINIYLTASVLRYLKNPSEHSVLSSQLDQILNRIPLFLSHSANHPHVTQANKERRLGVQPAIQNRLYANLISVPETVT